MSKLNVDQKTIKDLFQDKRADFLINARMRGAKPNVVRFGMIFFRSLFLMKDVQNSTATVNIFSDR
mgnify:CR=1 FL=1